MAQTVHLVPPQVVRHRLHRKVTRSSQWDLSIRGRRVELQCHIRDKGHLCIQVLYIKIDFRFRRHPIFPSNWFEFWNKGKWQLTLIFWARSLKPLSRYLPRIKIWRVLVSNTILWQDLGEGPPSFSVSMDKSFHLMFTISNAQKSAKSRFPSHPPKRYSTYKKN